ncbi:uncharacterized protein LOC114716630 [Neltuma alba]|uniref:uncharacterized protein LOC114716630 n=1 Tax=Neltuma alba TaxID=207710 RepID=UPI0010A4C2A7|nr:uncharacterized protein LOC114716630 [Prosopis alba]
MGFEKIEVECDTDQIIQEIKQEARIKGSYLISRKLKDLLKLQWQVEFNHVFREGNQVADKLAAMSHEMKARRLTWAAPPGWIEELVKMDASGFETLRRIVVR